MPTVLRVLCPSLDPKLARQPDVVGGSADHHAELARLDHAPQIRVEERQVVRSELERAGLRLARLKGQLDKAAELFDGRRNAAHHVVDVELDGLLARPIADVLHFQLQLDPFRRRQFPAR